MARTPRTFDFGNNGGASDSTPAPTPTPAATPNRPKTFEFAAPPPVQHEDPFAGAKIVTERPRTLDIPTAPVKRAERPKTKTDELVAKALGIDPTVPHYRLSGRIDMLLVSPVSELVNWGQQNLTPLQDASNIQTRVTADLNRINPVKWLTEAKEASCKAPSFIDRFTNANSPAFYEAMLNKTRLELCTLMDDATKERTRFTPEVTDLHIDQLSLAVCIDEFQNDLSLYNIANQRAKTLLMAHQSGTILLQVLNQTIEQCANFIQQIDSLLNVTIPQWKIAYGNK